MQQDASHLKTLRPLEIEIPTTGPSVIGEDTIDP